MKKRRRGRKEKERRVRIAEKIKQEHGLQSSAINLEGMSKGYRACRDIIIGSNTFCHAMFEDAGPVTKTAHKNNGRQ